MQKYTNEFKLKRREYDSYLVLIPGWATDWQIFNTLNLDYNFVLPIKFWPFRFEKDILKWLKRNNVKKISLLGWSLGGFVATKFALKHPAIIDKVILVSIRKKYSQTEIAMIERQLRKSKSACLYNFYSQCFYSNSHIDWFKKSLVKAYLKKWDLDYLIKTLDYLRDSYIDSDKLKNIKNIKIIHGENDNIAPIEEAQTIKHDLPQAQFISIKDAGHIPFWSKEFHKIVA